MDKLNSGRNAARATADGPWSARREPPVGRVVLMHPAVHPRRNLESGALRVGSLAVSSCSSWTVDRTGHTAARRETEWLYIAHCLYS